MTDDLAPPDLLVLISQLCLEAGRIMEDTSTELATALPTDPAAINDRLQEFCDAALDTLALTAAAQALYRRRVSSCDQV